MQPSTILANGFVGVAARLGLEVHPSELLAAVLSVHRVLVELVVAIASNVAAACDDLLRYAVRLHEQTNLLVLADALALGFLGVPHSVKTMANVGVASVSCRDFALHGRLRSRPLGSDSSRFQLLQVFCLRLLDEVRPANLVFLVELVKILSALVAVVVVGIELRSRPDPVLLHFLLDLGVLGLEVHVLLVGQPLQLLFVASVEVVQVLQLQDQLLLGLGDVPDERTAPKLSHGDFQLLDLQGAGPIFVDAIDHVLDVRSLELKAGFLHDSMDFLGVEGFVTSFKVRRIVVRVAEQIRNAQLLLIHEFRDSLKSGGGPFRTLHLRICHRSSLPVLGSFLDLLRHLVPNLPNLLATFVGAESHFKVLDADVFDSWIAVHLLNQLGAALAGDVDASFEQNPRELLGVELLVMSLKEGRVILRVSEQVDHAQALDLDKILHDLQQAGRLQILGVTQDHSARSRFSPRCGSTSLFTLASHGDAFRGWLRLRSGSDRDGLGDGIDPVCVALCGGSLQTHSLPLRRKLEPVRPLRNL
mmetsp:Transcript_45396/g.97317  ORF Transcript_45396/g.97317 Transcript_45396/m.97317 type:complete len:531 (-) Transcript_45396:226-1818(-)